MMQQPGDVLNLKCALCGESMGQAAAGQSVLEVLGPHLMDIHGFMVADIRDLNYFAWINGYSFSRDDGTAVVEGRYAEQAQL